MCFPPSASHSDATSMIDANAQRATKQNQYPWLIYWIYWRIVHFSCIIQLLISWLHLKTTVPVPHSVLLTMIHKMTQTIHLHQGNSREGHRETEWVSRGGGEREKSIPTGFYYCRGERESRVGCCCCISLIGTFGGRADGHSTVIAPVGAEAAEIWIS